MIPIFEKNVVQHQQKSTRNIAFHNRFNHYLKGLHYEPHCFEKEGTAN